MIRFAACVKCSKDQNTCERLSRLLEAIRQSGQEVTRVDHKCPDRVTYSELARQPKPKTFLGGLVTLENGEWILPTDNCGRGKHEMRFNRATRETLCIHCGIDLSNDIPF